MGGGLTQQHQHSQDRRAQITSGGGPDTTALGVGAPPIDGFGLWQGDEGRGFDVGMEAGAGAYGDGAFGFDGLMEGMEGSHIFDLPPLWEEPPLSGSSPLSNWWDTSPGALSSASWDSGIGFGGFAGDIQSPTPVGVHAGVFPRSGEGEGEQPRQHRTPSPRGEQEGGSGGNAFIPHTDRTTSYGYPYYPIIGDGNGGINPQFLQRIGLCYDPRTTPETSHATQQQRAKTPAYQGPYFEPEEEKFRPQSVPPQTIHTHGFSPRSPLVKERPPSVKPQIALDRRNFSPKSGAQTPQPTTDGWYITSTPESFKQQVSPPAIQRRKKQFVTESPGSRAKGQGNWMNESDDQSDIRQMFKRDYKPPEKPWDTDSLNYDEIGWLAKMRTSCHGPVTYAWCLTIMHNLRTKQVLVLSGAFAGQVRTVREYDLKRYSSETVRALQVAGEDVDQNVTLTNEEIMMKRGTIGKTQLASPIYLK